MRASTPDVASSEGCRRRSDAVVPRAVFSSELVVDDQPRSPRPLQPALGQIPLSESPVLVDETGRLPRCEPSGAEAGVAMFRRANGLVRCLRDAARSPFELVGWPNRGRTRPDPLNDEGNAVAFRWPARARGCDNPCSHAGGVDDQAGSTQVSVAAARRPDDDLSRSRVQAEAWVSAVGALLTVLAFAGFLLAFGGAAETRLGGALGFVAAAVYLLIVGFLLYGGLVYQFARLGYMRRRVRFRHAGADELRAFATESEARVTVLVPSYKEEPGVVRRTLLSAALQEYRHRRVVLLIDDPPNPSGEEDRRALAAVRELPGEVHALLARAREPFARAARRAERSVLDGRFDRRKATRDLAELYMRAASWFEAQAAAHPIEDHSAALFVELNLREPAGRHAARAKALRKRLTATNGCPTQEEILRSHRELDALFAAEVSSFERKRYANLSHAPNKAMNLNSYIALMGRWVAESRIESGPALDVLVRPGVGREVPDADYVLTLDADSLIEPCYMARLVHFLERPENSRVAVAQTPYCAVPQAERTIERIAGATTDIQYVIHQGFTAHGATYWVGANALLRKRALEDIVTTVEDERTGQRHLSYIQDRTVIEDTESSVDLVQRGWALFNYPARLSYSATPPDFGALVVQRRRWANGGLLILPKLLRVLRRRHAEGAGVLHGFMRLHYLTSIAAVNVGLVVLFVVPFADWYANAWLPLMAVPYFALYTHDLRLAGYRARDVVKVYALNLILVPVNLGGVVKSLHQAVTGRATPFARTPKVRDRTAAPALYVVAPYLLVLMLAFGAVFSIVGGHYFEAVASAANALLLLYGIGAFIGWRHSREDISTRWRDSFPSRRDPVTEERATPRVATVWIAEPEPAASRRSFVEDRLEPAQEAGV